MIYPHTTILYGAIMTMKIHQMDTHKNTATYLAHEMPRLQSPTLTIAAVPYPYAPLNEKEEMGATT
jgi:hypothetical protein